MIVHAPTPTIRPRFRFTLRALLAVVTIAGVSLGSYIYCYNPAMPKWFKLKSSQQKFWLWFQKNSDRLFNFERDQDAVFSDLSTNLHAVHRDLTFEFGPIRDGQREFVISAEGITQAFPAVQALADAAPPLERWIVVKFRQRHLPLNELRYGPSAVLPDNVECALYEAGDLIGLYMFLPDSVLHDHRTAVGFLLLDQALGEYDVATKVGPIEIEERTAHGKGPTFPYTELPDRFDEFWSRTHQK